MNPRRILVLRGGAIGDFILTLPVLQALRARWSDTYIELAGYPRIAGLARAGGLVDGFVSLDRADMAGWFAKDWAPGPGDSEWIRSFDLVLNYLHDPDGIVNAHLLAAGARKLVVGSPPSLCGSPQARPLSRWPTEEVGFRTGGRSCAEPLITGARPHGARDVIAESAVSGGHATDQLLRPLCELGIETAGAGVPRVRLGAALEERARAVLRPIGERVIVLHPGSGSPRKNWPLEKFRVLAKIILNSPGEGRRPRRPPMVRQRLPQDLMPVFSFGEADGELEAQFRLMAPAFPVLPGMPLEELAAVLAVSRAYIGNDSGITHLAAAVGVPTVALFGPTDPDVWGPRGDHVTVIRADPPTEEGLRRLAVEAVCEALRRTR